MSLLLLFGGSAPTNKTLTCVQGAAVAAGATATLTASRTLASSAGAATAAGATATVKVDRVVTASPGSAVAAGASATLTFPRVIQAVPGSAVATGAVATLFRYRSGYSPVSLPAWHSLFDATGTGGVDAPAPLPSLSFVLSTAAGRSIPASTGSFALTGKTSNLKVGHKFSAAVGSYVLTLNSATLAYTQTSQGISAAVPLPSLATLFDGRANSGTGAAAPLPSMSMLFERAATDKYMGASAGNFLVTGNPLSFYKGVALAAGTGTFVVQVAPAERDTQITAGTGSFALSGTAVDFVRRNGNGVSGSGTYAITTVPATLRVIRSLSAGTGSFVVTGKDSVLTVWTNHIFAGTGSFVVTPGYASLTKRGVTGGVGRRRRDKDEIKKLLERLRKKDMPEAERIFRRALKRAPALKKLDEYVAQELRTFEPVEQPLFPAVPFFEPLMEATDYDAERAFLRAVAKRIQDEMDEEDDADVLLLTV